MSQKKCIVCGKAPADTFKVCIACGKAHDSTTGDRLRKGK